MGKVQSSPEVVRQMKGDLAKTVKNIEDIRQTIGASARTAASWNDAQGEQYRSLMQKIARLTTSPVDTLNQAMPKLEKLAQALDQYNKVKF